jgi:hypothetical protein
MHTLRCETPQRGEEGQASYSVGARTPSVEPYGAQHAIIELKGLSVGREVPPGDPAFRRDVDHSL